MTTTSSSLVEVCPAHSAAGMLDFAVIGLQKCSLVDYPGKVAAVVFTPGCNMNCFYCHNRRIISMHDHGEELIAPDDILGMLKKRTGFLGGVVISGGEPTLQPGLESFIRKVRALGYSVKLDTNGTNPELLSRLITEGLVDYVAMDVKAPRNRYHEFCGKGFDLDDIDASMQILLQGHVDYEFRTTVPSQLGISDLLDVARWIKGAKRYFIQQYRPQAHGDIRCAELAHAPETVRLFAEEVRHHLGCCEARGVGAATTVVQPLAPVELPAAHLLSIPVSAA